MFTRPTPTQTIADLRSQVGSTEPQVDQVITTDVEVSITDGLVRFGNRELPASMDALTALGSWLDVPTPFLKRIDSELRETVLNTLLRRSPATVAIAYTDNGITDVRDPGQRVIPVARLIDVASRAISPEAMVTQAVIEQDLFLLDVIVPEDFDRGVGGDSKVNDILLGGITIEQNRKQNLAPQVAPYMYRLACTNGMVTRQDVDKIDARGSSVEEVLAELETLAQRVFSRVEAEMEAFYDLRSQRVDNPERTLLRMAEERGIPTRTAHRLLERVPAMDDDNEGEVSMFDLVNLVTNQANDPSIAGRSSVRRALETAGGAIVTDHQERCGHCQQSLIS
jgi:hypothetical protein